MPKSTDPMTSWLTPAEIEKLILECPYQPMGTKFVIYVPPVEEKSAAGIIVGTAEELRREHRGMVHGYIAAKGALAFADFKEFDSSVDVPLGARVTFARFEGRMPDNAGEYRVLQDSDIDCIVLDAEQIKKRNDQMQAPARQVAA